MTKQEWLDKYWKMVWATTQATGKKKSKKMLNEIYEILKKTEPKENWQTKSEPVKIEDLLAKWRSK